MFPSARDSVVPVVLCVLVATGCRASAKLEPLGGFELLEPVLQRGELLEPSVLARWLAEARVALDAIADYRAVLETRERVDDELFPRRVIRVALRHEPFCVALETLAPPSEEGQRVWYDAAADEPALIAETPGLLGALIGRVALDPEGDLAMQNRRHPITDIGLRRLLEQVEHELGPTLARLPALRLAAWPVEIDARPARLVEAELARAAPAPPLVHRLGFDAASGLLVYYGLAELAPSGPELVEEYLYRALEPNAGLGPAEFAPPE